MSKTCVCGNDMTKEEWKHQWVCHHCGRTKPISIKQTNADKYFRNATDEELAHLFVQISLWRKPATYTVDGFCLDNGVVKEKEWLEWLKQEVKNDG